MTLRRWADERIQPGDPVDAGPEGGIPDTLNLPLEFVLLALALPTAGLWWAERRMRAKSGLLVPHSGRAPRWL